MFRLSQFAAPTMGIALFLGAQGCSHEHPDAVPSSAKELSVGSEMITATAPDDGMVYVYDITSNTSLYTGKVNKGDTVKVDAKANKLFLDDKLITQREDLRNSHRYKIFFDQKEMEHEHAANATLEQQAVPAAGTTVVVPSNSEGKTTITVPSGQNATVNGSTVVVEPQQPASTR